MNIHSVFFIVQLHKSSAETTSVDCSILQLMTRLIFVSRLKRLFVSNLINLIQYRAPIKIDRFSQFYFSSSVAMSLPSNIAAGDAHAQVEVTARADAVRITQLFEQQDAHDDKSTDIATALMHEELAHDKQDSTLTDVPTGRHGSAARLQPTDDDGDGGPPSTRRIRRSSPDSSQVGSRSPIRGLIEPDATLPQTPLRVDLSPGRTQPLIPSARERARAISVRGRAHSARPSRLGEETQPRGSRSKRTLPQDSSAPVSLPSLEPTPAILATGLEPAVDHVSSPAPSGHTLLVSDNGLDGEDEVMIHCQTIDPVQADAGHDAPSEVILQTQVIEGQDPTPSEVPPVSKAAPKPRAASKPKVAPEPKVAPKPKIEPKPKPAPTLVLRMDHVDSRIDAMSSDFAAIESRVVFLEQSDVANHKHFESEMLLQQQSVDSRFELMQTFISAVMDRIGDQDSTSTPSSSNDAMTVMGTRLHELEIVVKTNHELDSNLDMLDRLAALDKRCHSALQEVSDRMHRISERFTDMHVKSVQTRTADIESKDADKALMLANIADLNDKIAKIGQSDAPQGTQASPAPEPAPAPAPVPAQAQSSPTVQASQGVGQDPWTAPAADPWSSTVAPPQSASPAPQATPASTLVAPVAPAAPMDWTMAQPASPPTFVASSVPISGPPYVAPTFGAAPPPMVNWGGLQPPAAAPAAAPVPLCNRT